MTKECKIKMTVESLAMSTVTILADQVKKLTTYQIARWHFYSLS